MLSGLRNGNVLILVHPLDPVIPATLDPTKEYENEQSYPPASLRPVINTWYEKDPAGIAPSGSR